jgi:hypothetical protein
MLLKALLTMSVVLAGCGAPSNAPAKKADFIVTLDGIHHVCVVALANEEHGSSIACSDVIPFLKDELRLPAGAIYDLHKTAQVGDAQAASVRENLTAAGYRFISGP